MSRKKLTYEQASNELQQILTALQGENIGLDDLARHLKRARELVEFCRHRLRDIEHDLEDLFEEE